MKTEKKYTKSAQRINEALIDCGLKAQDLADRTGIPKASISHYINGYYCPTATKARKMGEVLGVNPIWLMGFDVSKYTKNEAAYTDTGNFIQDIVARLRGESSFAIEAKTPIRQKVDDRINGYDERTLERLLTYLDFFEKMNGGDPK